MNEGVWDGLESLWGWELTRNIGKYRIRNGDLESSQANLAGTPFVRPQLNATLVDRATL